ncbi:BEN domain-containing protein 7 isoform X2 [Accipiter gentilis]|uniref:BEN domain-containing protein 7 isoform X2 n=1 Tax=Astur gentilis TaxID=8957 RepID=UPI00210F9FF0|nr:BEN domain-containing protein 7 isoform X2 [Accipiter gentilis]
MEFTQRKRSRKSQSFKLINEGDESREIKKQVTGMRRLLNDSTGRIYQRVGKEGEKLKEEPQDLDLAWAQRLNPPAESQASLHPSQSGAWNELSPQASHFSGQYGTRSKTFQNQTRTVTSNGEIPMMNSSIGPNCCTCNCQSTLQAILQELKTMRKLMQIQAVGTQNRQQPPVPLICAQKSTISRKRNKKKKLPLKTVEPITVNKKPNSAENEKKLSANSERSSLQAIEPSLKPETPVSGFGIILESASSDPEVQLAEGFDVFMPKSQLDSILSNYTRSGSLLFRKLVCAFFDDKTLANSLPNGKRKRGLNDNRKGLDQNIVGAIKVFTEKYCTANHVDKLPGPRDWVQILQDQIKLARRRLKRGSALSIQVLLSKEQTSRWTLERQTYIRSSTIFGRRGGLSKEMTTRIVLQKLLSSKQRTEKRLQIPTVGSIPACPVLQAGTRQSLAGSLWVRLSKANLLSCLE